MEYNKYRINEVEYDNGKVIYFAENYAPWYISMKWQSIGDPLGYDRLESAAKEIEKHKAYYFSPKPVRSQIHEFYEKR